MLRWSGQGKGKELRARACAEVQASALRVNVPWLVKNLDNQGLGWLAGRASLCAASRRLVVPLQGLLHGLTMRVSAAAALARTLLHSTAWWVAPLFVLSLRRCGC